MLELLKPYDIKSNKVRLGPEGDGGYVVPELAIEKCTTLFTYGYGGDKRFEDDFIAKYKKANYLFDHTVGIDNWDSGDQHFIDEGLGSSFDNESEMKEKLEKLLDKPQLLNQMFEEFKQDIKNKTLIRKLRTRLHDDAEDFKNFLNYVSVRDVKDHYQMLNVSGDILLKIDTEGAEYDYFMNVDVDNLASFTSGLIVEFHWIDQEHNRQRFIQILNKLNPHYILTHFHGNNWGGEFTFEGKNVPRVPELTFVNRKHVTEFSLDDRDYPIAGLDFPNNGNAADCDLSFLKSV